MLDRLEQLLSLTGVDPLSVSARYLVGAGESRGIGIAVRFHGGLTADLEYHPSSLVPLATGWVIAGTDGGYRDFEVFTVTGAEDWLTGLRKAHVEPDPDARREIIVRESRALTAALGHEVELDPGLLEEVVGLVEWPVPLLGTFEVRKISDRGTVSSTEETKRAPLIMSAGDPSPPRHTRDKVGVRS